MITFDVGYPYRVTLHFEGLKKTKQMVSLNNFVMSQSKMAAYGVYGSPQRMMAPKAMIITNLVVNYCVSVKQ